MAQNPSVPISCQTAIFNSERSVYKNMDHALRELIRLKIRPALGKGLRVENSNVRPRAGTQSAAIFQTKPLRG